MRSVQQLSCIAGLVVEDGNVTDGQAALLEKAGIPALVGVAGLFAAIESGERVSIDADRGLLHL